jgi:hypothetical protein
MKIHDSSLSILDYGIEQPSAPSQPSSSPGIPTPPAQVSVPAEKRALLLSIDEVVPQKQTERRSIPLSSLETISDAKDGITLTTFQGNSGLLSRAVNWIRKRQQGRSNTRRLQVAATVSLGEKRFAAVIQVDGQQFLIGGGATNVALLAQLNGTGSFGTLLKESMVAPQELIALPPEVQVRERA